MNALRTSSLLLMATLSFPAFAEEPRKINFTTVILNQDEKPMRECADDPAPKKDEECKLWQSVTIGMVVMRALAMPEQGLAADVSLKRGQLALRVYKAEDAVLTAEEVTTIKTQMAKMYSPLVIARAFPILDPATAK